MKDLRVIKIVKETKFEGVCSELEAKKCFHRQLFTKYLRLTPVSLWNSAHYDKSLISILQEGFASIDEIFIWERRLGIRLSFYDL